jgi:hypothetical protein
MQRNIFPFPTKAKQMPVMLPGQYIEQLVRGWVYCERNAWAISNMKGGIVKGQDLRSSHTNANYWIRTVLCGNRIRMAVQVTVGIAQLIHDPRVKD